MTDVTHGTVVYRPTPNTVVSKSGQPDATSRRNKSFGINQLFAEIRVNA